MKVTFVVTNYTPSIGGAQTLVRRVAEGLVADFGHDVEVLTTDALRRPSSRDAGKVQIRRERINGVEVRRFPVARRTHGLLRALRRVGRRLGLTSRSARSLIEVGPIALRMSRAIRRALVSDDVVVFVIAPSLTSSIAGSDARGSAVRVLLPLLHITTADPISPMSFRALTRADLCVANTDYERSWFVTHGVDPARTAVLPPGCDPAEYPDIDQSSARARLGLPERPTVGYVGRMAAHKGVDTLLAAMERIWQSCPDTTLLIAGNPSAWPEFDRLVERARPLAGDRLAIRTGFADDERGLLLAACDVVAFPSREESFGMVTIEAWCARRPVVAADIPVVRELITPDVGALVPVGDERALECSIISLLRDPARRSLLGAAGRRKAEADFEWHQIVDRWNTHLSESVARCADSDAPMVGEHR